MTHYCIELGNGPNNKLIYKLSCGSFDHGTSLVSGNIASLGYFGSRRGAPSRINNTGGDDATDGDEDQPSGLAPHSGMATLRRDAALRKRPPQGFRPSPERRRREGRVGRRTSGKRRPNRRGGDLVSSPAFRPPQSLKITRFP